MMITTFHKKNFLLSIGLFLAIVTLLASPAKADCKDDPNYEFKPPKKNGSKRGCQWIAGLKKEARKNKICGKTKKGLKVRDMCPETCGKTDCDPTECPLEEPKNGSTCLVGAGKTCYYDYALMGCTADDATCTASRFYDCTKSGNWAMVLVDPPNCGGPPEPPIGEPCDPKEFCTVEPPKEGSPCTQAQQGLSCVHHSFMGCNFQDGYTCTPKDTYVCDNETWDLYSIELALCPDPVQDGATGLPCEVCPKVVPEEFCPAEKPTPGRECFINYKGACEYDFKHTGCTAEELECTSSTSFFCESGRWQEGVSLFPIICPPTGKECPKEPPQKGPCRMQGYDPGLKCDYSYKDMSCVEGVENCLPTEHWTCTEYLGWIGTHTDYVCLEYPDDFGHACGCPVEEPNPLEDGEACNPGVSCGYGYHFTGCTPDEVQCSPQREYTCNDEGTWDAPLVSLPIVCDEPPTGVGDRCDPLGCPYNPPAHDSPCDPDQLALECPYYEYQGCSYADGFRCTEFVTAVCNKDLKWDSVPLVDMCVGGDPDSVQGQKCEPCPEVKPEGICPSKQPLAGEKCDDDIWCDYNFQVHGCSADELQCMPESFSQCSNGEWVQGVYDPKPCPPRVGKPCPVAKPDANGDCQGHNIGLRCDYEYHDIGCDDETVECKPSEIYTCTDFGWLVEVTSVFCPGGDFPDKFGQPCICPEEKAEPGDPCDDLVGLSCGYNYVNTSCDENVEVCSPMEMHTCTEKGWRVATPLFFCPEGYPPDFLESCDPM